MSFVIDITSETMPTFDDPKTYQCQYDGQTFNDAGVYQQHLLMYHGVNISLIADDGSTIKAPISPVIPPPDPYFIPAPGVTLLPLPGGNYTVTDSQLDTRVRLKPGVQPIFGSQSVTGNVTALAMLGIVVAILANGKKRGI
jgi:hypothetical protein